MGMNGDERTLVDGRQWTDVDGQMELNERTATDVELNGDEHKI